MRDLLRALLVLACLPLLLPSGLCVCEATQTGCFETASHLEGVGFKPAAPVKSCPNCRPHDDDSRTPSDAPHSPHRGPMESCPHAFHSPLAAGPDRVESVELPRSLADALVSIAAIPFADTDRMVPFAAARSAGIYSNSPPLWLAHCSLTI